MLHFKMRHPVWILLHLKKFVVTDDESTLVQSAIEDSQIAKDELQSAIMLYNDGFPCGQETFLENGMYF